MNRLVCAILLAFSAFSLFSQAEDDPLAGLMDSKDPYELVNTLTNLLPELPPDALHRGLIILAEAEEMLGYLDDARRHYLQAAFTAMESRDTESMLDSATILIELGGLEEAETICKAVQNISRDTAVLERARILSSRLAFLNESPESAWDIIEETILPVSTDHLPSTLYWVQHLAGITGHEDVRERAETALGESGEKHPEFMLVRGAADQFPSPAGFFGLFDGATSDEAFPGPPDEVKPARVDTEDSVAIQTGSFTDRENAEYHVKDLAEAGFTAEIIEKNLSGKVYHSVVIRNIPAEEVQHYLIRLKDQGYEGWPLYD